MTEAEFLALLLTDAVPIVENAVAKELPVIASEVKAALDTMTAFLQKRQLSAAQLAADVDAAADAAADAKYGPKT